MILESILAQSAVRGSGFTIRTIGSTKDIDLLPGFREDSYFAHIHAFWHMMRNSMPLWRHGNKKELKGEKRNVLLSGKIKGSGNIRKVC